MALVRCKECEKEVSDSATKCPHCGARLKKSIVVILLKISLCVLGAVVLLAIYVGITTPKYESDALAVREVCEKYIANNNRASLAWQECREIYNDSISKGREEESGKNAKSRLSDEDERNRIEQSTAYKEEIASRKKQENEDAEMARKECAMSVDNKKNEYSKLMSERKYWEAAIVIRRCANLTEDKALNGMLSDAEIKSYLQDYRNAKNTKHKRNDALESLERHYPEQVRKLKLTKIL